MKQLGRQLLYLIRTPKAMRMMVLGVALVIYVKLRSFLAVDQLVRIYREVSRTVLDPQAPWISELLLLSSSIGAFPVDFQQVSMSADDVSKWDVLHHADIIQEPCQLQ